MSVERRLDRLYPVLSARERAVLVLQAWKEGREEDGMVRATIPSGQGREFNRLIGLMNGLNRGVGMITTVLQAQMTTLEMKHAWLMWVLLSGDALEDLSHYLLTGVKEPVTESGLAARRAELGAELLSLADAAALMADERGYAEHEMAVTDGWRHPMDAAWEREERKARAAIRDAIASGAIAARGKGARAKLRLADLHAWWRRPFEVLPEWGSEYDVLPDTQAATVERRSVARDAARRILRLLCPRVEWSITLEQVPDAPDGDEFASSVARALVYAIATQAREQWANARACEVVAAEAWDEFGEDPLRPLIREALDDVKTRLTVLVEEIAPYTGALELPEPDDALLDMARTLVARGAD